MININLLPWREALQKRASRKLLVGISTQIVLTIFICLLINFYASYRAISAGPDKGMLNNAINQTNMQIKTLESYKKKLVGLKKQKNVLLNLYHNKFQAILILQEIEKALPKTINLDRIVRKKEGVVIYGTAPSNNQVTQLIENLSSNEIILNPVLKESKTVTHDDKVEIKFQIDAELNSQLNSLRVKEDGKTKK